jgi:uncharacterized protein
MSEPKYAGFLPGRHVIEGYGGGGFRFAGMSHRGSLLCLPDGIWPWDVTASDAVSAQALAPVLARAADLDFFILGTGAEPWLIPQPLRDAFREAHISIDSMTTGAAVRTYNVMLMENRRVGAGLIVVE